MPEPDDRHVVTLEINGTRKTVVVEARKLLVHLIREDLGLTGTHVGCDTSQCGACTVEIDGQAIKSCTVLAVMADGASITTIEGLTDKGPNSARFRRRSMSITLCNAASAPPAW